MAMKRGSSMAMKGGVPWPWKGEFHGHERGFHGHERGSFMAMKRGVPWP